MNKRQRFIIGRFMTALAALTFALVVTQGCSEGGHDDGEAPHEGEHGEIEDFTEPQTDAEACSVIHARLEEIAELMDTGKLDRVHAEAAVIRDVANDMAKLAAMKDSGVPSNAVREVNLTAKDLAAKFGPIDEAGDSGNLAGTRTVYDEMVALFETLDKYVDPDLVHEDHDHD